MASELVFQAGQMRIELVQGDITRIPVDAIVNAANAQLAGGGGVDGAIHRSGGPGIMRELDEIRERAGGCETGKAVVTGAGKLPAKYVFHAVGPVYRDGHNGEAWLLESCYSNCLALAEKHGVEVISFPSISTGIYGYPIHEAADIAVRTVAQRLREQAGPVRVVKLVQFSERDHQIYRASAEKFFGAVATGSTR